MKAVSPCPRIVSVSHGFLLALSMAFGPAQAEDPAAKTAVAPPVAVQQKSPVVQSVPTHLLHKALVQDVVRVGERIFLAGERGHIGWSDDHGNTWTQAKVPTLQDVNALYFVTADVGWAVGHDGNIFNTTNAGKTWAMQLDGLAFNLTRAQAQMEQHAGALAAKQAELDAAQEQLDAAQAAAKPRAKLIAELEEKVSVLDEEVYELDFQVRDAEKILKEENAPWPLMDVWFADLNKGFAVGAFNAFLMTQDGGKTWVDASGLIENPDGLHLNVVGGMGSTVYILGEAGLVFRSTDAGASWQTLESPDEGSFFAIYPSKQADRPQLQVVIVGLEGSVYVSRDGGDTWERMENDLNYNLNGIYTDEKGLWLIVGNDGAVLRSTDGGKTFDPHRLLNQVTLSSVTVAADGNYILGGASGIQVVKPDQLPPLQ